MTACSGSHLALMMFCLVYQHLLPSANNCFGIVKKKNNIYCGCIALNHTILQYQEYDLSISVGQEINEQFSGDDDKYINTCSFDYFLKKATGKCIKNLQLPSKY